MKKDTEDFVIAPYIKDTPDYKKQGLVEGECSKCHEAVVHDPSMPSEIKISCPSCLADIALNALNV